jgi:hypothetical protein
MRARGDVCVAAAAFALVVALAGAGCDWRKFDDLKKHTPVLAVGAPSNYSSGDDFGPILLPLDPPADGSSAGRFVATATYKTSIGVMSFDAAGNVRGVGVTNDALNALAQGPVTAIAAIPGGQKVLLGAPAADLGTVLTMNVDPPYQTTTFHNLAEGQFGVGVAAGDIGGGAAPEYVVLSSNTLRVYLDGVNSTSSVFSYVSQGAADPCPIDLSALLPNRARANRPVMIASLLGTGTQIAVGTPTTSGSGHVSIFNFDATSGAITCAAALTAPEAHFGVAMTLVDTNGDGDKDSLLVGAPPTHAYLFTLPLSNGQNPSATATEPMTGGDFGGAVAALDLDGKPGDEMFVGNPDASVNDATTAGRVSIYTGATMTMLAGTTFPNPLVMHEPKSGHGFGAGIAGMPFCAGNTPSSADGGTTTTDAGLPLCTHLPLVGSLSKVYAYFTLKKPDPRAK